MNEYTVYEVADLLKTSHTTIYNKLNNKDIKKELRNFIKRQGKTTYISDVGVEILRKYVNNKESLKKDSVNFINKIDNKNNESLEEKEFKESKESIEVYKKLITSLESQIEDLKSDKEKLFREVEEQRRLHQNTQVLLKQEKEKILMLEEKDHKSIWQKIFKK